MRGIDLRLTSGNVIETAEKICAVCNGNLNITYSDSAEKEKRERALHKFIVKSISIRKCSDFLYERFPIILLPGGEQRENFYNVKAREKGLPACPVFKFDLDDGNSRVVSYAMSGLKSAPAYYPIKSPINP